ncbi:hypothetical protein [Kribbella shirazensis]|uniref:Uncharacterized protein n=1 Tax=Kribbella shirazensis TaxID=1105143 RepID=A0A7X5V8C6_9ACTN|nr:hypothetical protein [Kribbella shirazensis]NIK56516.1 hypothetical protein [Kribbella shirazensis]
MPEHDPEQELGPKISSALQDHAGHTGLQKSGLAREARRRVHRRRQAWSAAAGAVLVVAAVGGVWGVVGGESPVASQGDSASSEGAAAPRKTPDAVAPNAEGVECPPAHPIQQATSLQPTVGLDLSTPVTELRACRYSLTGAGLLGQQSFNAADAQQVVDAIKVLPERNPDLPVFKCAPQTAKPSEAIVLRFGTATGVREIWVVYDGCTDAGFFTGTHTYGLYSAPLKLFMKGEVRPTNGTYLRALGDW